jgi:hypothetical protein
LFGFCFGFFFFFKVGWLVRPTAHKKEANWDWTAFFQNGHLRLDSALEIFLEPKHPQAYLRQREDTSPCGWAVTLGTSISEDERGESGDLPGSWPTVFLFANKMGQASGKDLLPTLHNCSLAEIRFGFFFFFFLAFFGLFVII